MKKIFSLLIGCAMSFLSYAQVNNSDNTGQSLKLKQDSALRAMMRADSMKVEKEYSEKNRKAKLKSSMMYPQIQAGENSGVIPVKDPTEIPDPSLDYKLLFELSENNPDSASKEINAGLAEVARVINLHVASGIPVKKIFPVIVVRGQALNILTTNEYFKEHFKMDNPNIKLINDLNSIGAKFIACGQAMAKIDMNKEALLPPVKVALSVQTALSSYLLKGYAKMGK